VYEIVRIISTPTINWYKEVKTKKERKRKKERELLE